MKKPKPAKPALPEHARTETPSTKPKDVALVLGASDDGSKVAALRQRGDQVEAAVLSRVNEGEALHGEVVQLRPRDEANLYDVETLVLPPKVPRKTTGRPAQVASKGYRSGWGRVFGRKKKPTLH
ncbi:MAG: hypothetical protein AB8I08_18780 [Sandaracinaceae bacterium]